MRSTTFSWAAAWILAVVAVTGCEKRSRTHNSSGSSGLLEEGAAPATHVYRFVGVEQSLTDSRKAVQDERWEDAVAATEALLKQQPNNAEAKTMNQQAKLEAPNRLRFDEFSKAAAANEVAAAVRHYRAIAETSLYHERARPDFERLRGTFVDNQVADARALARAGRCDDARRVARTTGEWFPDTRARLDEAAAGCRPARGERETATEVAVSRAPAETKPEAPAPAPAMTAPLAMSAEAPKGALADAKPPLPAADSRTLASALPGAGTQVVPRPLAPAPAATPPAPLLPPAAAHNVPATELEKYRAAGDRTPSLPAGAKMIAHRDGVKRVTMAVKFCVSDAGVPTSATYVKSSDYNDANEQVLAEIRKWRFRPYVVDGRPTPVCTATLLNYQIE